jgi:4-amino-4-deoxy-L-arabinose transferase-like glycosyltransferase
MDYKLILHRLFKSPFFWIALFIVCVAPFSLSYEFIHMDEMYYSDAAITMTKTHDYFTPRLPDGETRFLKPILTYWLIAGSYALLGINAISTRLPFLLLGAVLLYLTYRIARRISHNNNVSILSVMLLAGNPMVIQSASRAIPDMPQTVFFTLGALGLTGIVASEKPNKKDTWTFYLGFALAFATKGLPAAFFFGLSVLFLLLNPWRKYKLNDLINWPAAFVSLIIALWWFVLMYYLHGQLFLDSFLTRSGFRTGFRTDIRGLKTSYWLSFLSRLFLPLAIHGPPRYQAQRSAYTKFSAERKMFFALTLLWTLTNVYSRNIHR